VCIYVCVYMYILICIHTYFCSHANTNMDSLQIFIRTAFQHTAVYCNKLQHTVTHLANVITHSSSLPTQQLQHTATHCSTLQHVAHLHVYTLTSALQNQRWQHTTTHCKILHMQHIPTRYGVATISRLLKIKGLFCKRAL